MLTTTIHKSLESLKDLLEKLPDDQYVRQCPHLSNATIGEHTRHIIEMFQCLGKFYDSGVVNYDKRERNQTIQNKTEFAIKNIDEIQENLNRENKKLQLLQVIENEEIKIESNYFRELLYNLEHCIHHQALIKVAVLQCENIKISEDFGVARSTIEYRNQCVQ